MKKGKISLRIAALIGAVEVLTMVILFLVINYQMTGLLRAKAEGDMLVIASDRAQIVETYIMDCCDYLNGYSRYIEAREALQHPEDPEAIQRLQEATDRYAAGYHDIEGLYIAQWDTFVLAHVNPDSVGKTFREGEAAAALEQQIRTLGKSFCTGIVQAPVTKRMVIPVYAPVYDAGGEMLGFAGAAFYSEDLAELLDGTTGEQDAALGYALVNMDTGVYIFHNDPALVGQTCEDPGILALIQKAANGAVSDADLTWTDESSVDSCCLMQDRNWLFVVTDSSAHVFSIVSTVRIRLLVICLISTIVMVLICFLSVEWQMRPMRLINRRIDNLKAYNFSQDDLLVQCCTRSDEFGAIANAMEELRSVLENQNQLFLEMLEGQNVGTLVTNAEDTEVILINTTAMELYGIPPEKKGNVTIEDIRKAFPLEELQKIDAMRSLAKVTEDEINFESAIVHEDGKKLYILSGARSVTLSNGDQVVIFSIVDITERKALEENLLLLSETDFLTGICNRRSGEYRIAQILDQGDVGMFCLFDVNKFKIVNDTFGHKVGDKVLVAIAECMKKTFRSTDVIIRLGGDEFVVYATEIKDKQIGQSVIERFLGNIKRIEVEELKGHELSISLGAVLVEEKMDFGKMYVQADSLMYTCKEKGGNAYAFYEG